MSTFYELGANTGGTYDTLDKNFDVVADHMQRRYGMTEENHTRDEIIESFENAMRGFNSGNSVRVTSELAYLSKAKDPDILAAQSAYELWDSSGSVFKSDAGAGEKIDALGDYTRSFLADPVNFVSLGFGRIATKGSTAGARKLAQEAARAAAERAVARAASNGVSKAGQDQVRRTAFAAAQRNILRNQADDLLADEAQREVIRRAPKRAFWADTAATTASEMAIGGAGVDALYQQAQIKAGRASEYSWEQGAAATLAGGLGGVLAVGLAALKGTSSLNLASLNLERSTEIADRAAKLRYAEAQETLDTQKAAQLVKDNKDTFRKLFKEVVVDVTDFAEKVSKGELMKVGGALDSPELRSPYIMSMIMNGDTQLGIKGINQILEEIGVPKYQKRGPKDTRTNYVGDILTKLPKSVQRDIEKLANNALKEVDPEFKGFSIKELTNFSAETASNAGRALRAFRGQVETAQKLGKPVDELTVSDMLEAEVNPLGTLRETRKATADGGEELVEEGVVSQAEGLVERFQRRWISMLITHPATTAVNAVGWAGASAHQSFSDVFKGALYGGRGILQGGFTGEAKKDLRRMSRLWGLQLQKIKNLADPYETLDSFMDYVTVRPHLQKEMFSYISGGVESSKSLVGMGVDPSDTLSLSKPQQVQKFFQTMYGVRAQDFLSKAQEYMYALDKVIRENYDMTLNDFMSQDNLHEYLMDSNHQSFKEFMRIETQATSQALENIFAKSYKNEPGAIGAVAKVIEDARNIPIIGTFVPFGQFFNNTVAYMLKSTPLNPAYHLWLKATHNSGRKVSGNPLEAMAKFSSAMGIAGMLAVREMDNLEEGLAWSEERLDGTVVDRALDFPYSYWKMLGRGFAHLKRDGEIPPELLDEFQRTFGSETITRSIGDTAEELNNVFKMAASGEIPKAGEAFAKAITETGANYVSGATRVFDPFNQIMATQRGEDYVAVDRNQGNQFLNKSLRYVDQFLENVNVANTSGNNLAPEREQALQGESQRANLSKLFGIREALPATSIQKMYNEIGRPDWIDGINIPDHQAENVFRQYFFPFIEMEADRLYDEAAWSKLNIQQKTEIIDRVLANTRTKVREYLLRSTNPTDRKAGLIAAIDGKNLRTPEVREILGMFEVSDTELHTLSIPQLEMILSLMDLDSRSDQELRDRLGVD